MSEHGVELEILVCGCHKVIQTGVDIFTRVRDPFSDVCLEVFVVSRQKSSVVFGDGKIRIGDALINDSGCYCTLGCILSQNFSLCTNNKDAVYALASTHFFPPGTDVYVPSRIVETTEASSSSSPLYPTYVIPNGCTLELRLFGRVL